MTMLITQAIAEYSAASAVASAVASLIYQFKGAIAEDGISVLLFIGAGALVWSWLLRSK